MSVHRSTNSMMPKLSFALVLSVALATLGSGCDSAPKPAAKGEACDYSGANAKLASCTADLYCHPSRDADGELVLEAHGDKKSAVGECREKIAAGAACTKDSVCVSGHTCGWDEPTDDEGSCIPESEGSK